MPKPTKLVATLDSWRDRYNPLRGLTMTRIVSLLESMNAGNFTDLMWVYKHIEETDPDGIALVERGLSALEELDYDIKIASEEKHPGTWDKALAEDQRAFLAQRYEQIENLSECIPHLAMGFFRKYAFAQILSNPEGPIQRFELLDPWNFLREGMRGPFYWNPSAKSTTWKSCGEPLDRKRDRLIVMEYDRHVDRYGLIKFGRANLSEKDWDGFIELFGFNQTIVILPEDVPPEKLDEYLASAQDISSGGDGALPGGSDVKYGNDSRGQQPFRPRLEWLQQQHILAGTGGMLTMLTQSGSGSLAGGAHADTWKTLSRARGHRVSSLLNRDFDRPELAREFPGKPVLAYFALATNEEQDVGDVVEHAVKIRTAFPTRTMDPDEFQEKTGYRLVALDSAAAPETQPIKPDPDAPDAPDADEPDPPQVTARRTNWLARLLGRDRDVREQAEDVTAALIDNGIDLAIEAERADMRPLAERLYALLAIQDNRDMFRDAARQLKADLATMGADILAHPKLADVIEQCIGPGIVNGIAEGVAARPQPKGGE